MKISDVHIAMYSYWLSFGENKRCMNCNKILPKEFSLVNVDHLLEKSVYKDVKLEEKFFFLICGNCHHLRNNGFPGKIHKKAIKNAEEKYKNRL